MMIQIAVFASGRGTNLQAVIDAIKTGSIDGEIRIVISDNPGAYALQRAKNNQIERRVFYYKQYKSKAEYELDYSVS